MRINIPVAVLEFDSGSHTLWVHNEDGATVLRLKLPPGVTFATEEGCINIASHCDVTCLKVATVELNGKSVVPFCLRDQT